jgi:hypothetical protein
LAYQPPANSTFLSEQTSHQQPASSTFLRTNKHQPSATSQTNRPLIRIEDAVNQVISIFKLHPGLFQILPYNYSVGYLLSNQWEGIYLKVVVSVPTSGNIRVLDGCVISTLMFSGCHH